MSSLLKTWRSIFNHLPDQLQHATLRHLPPGIKEIDLTLPGGEKLIFDNLKLSEIFKCLAWKGFGGYEYATVKLFYHLAKKSQVIFDIGSYFGYFSLIAAKANPRAQILSLEPVQESVRLQKRYIELNKISNIAVYEMAIGQEPGEATFYLPTKSLSRVPNIGSLRNRFAPGELFSDRPYMEHKVQVTTLKTILEANSIHSLDLIKIDTEETESEILAASRDILIRLKPDIIIEIIPEGSSARVTCDILNSIGYRLFIITQNSLIHCDTNDMKNMLKIFRNNHNRNYGELYCTCRTHDNIIVPNMSIS